MKTILIPIYNGIRARNFFRSDTYTQLVRDPNLRLVIVIPPSKLEFYRSEFPEENVRFEPHEIISEPRFGRWLAVIAFNLLHTDTMLYKQKLEYLRYRNLPRFIAKRLLNRLLGPFTFLRHVIRFLDRYVATDPVVDALLKKHCPDLVLVPDIVFAADRIYLRAAKRRGIFVVGMIRSWDNLTSKGVIQILPDKLIVYTTLMKKEAMEYAGMPEKDIVITGVPHYDAFFRSRGVSREEFLRSLSIDPAKRIILCAPFFDKYTGSAVTIIHALVEAIEKGQLPKDIHILVRYRPATPEIPEGVLKPSPYVSITKPCSRYFEVMNEQAPTLDWEFTKEDLELLMNSLYFSNVVINTISTLSIDASVFDKPVVNVRFDADPKTPPQHSVDLVRKHDHYKSLEDTDGIWLAWSMDELIQAINQYLKDPSLHRAGRARIVADQIEFTDGQSGKRVAEYIKSLLLAPRPV